MGKQQVGQNGGFKRAKTSKESAKNQREGNSRPAVNEIAHSSFSGTSGESSEEHSVVDTDEELESVLCKEPTTYDNLLSKLGSSSQFLAKAYKKRQREEEGKSDTEEGSDSVSESISLSEEDAVDEEGTGSELSGSPTVRRSLQGSDLIGSIEHDEDAESDDDDDDETSDTDEHTLIANVQSSTETSVGTSSFSDHLCYKLSKAEIDNLSKRKWKYNWEVPAADVSNSKWTGTGECFIKDVDENSAYGLKLKLYKHWLNLYNATGGKDFHSSKQRLFFSLCNSYRDILHHNKKPFYFKGVDEDSSIMDAYIIHSLNHVFRTRDIVTRNDSKVAKHQDGAKEEILNNDDFLDHGFTRPKILLLLPLASIARRIVKRIIQLTPSTHKVNVEYTDRFFDEFGTGDDPSELQNESSEVHDNDNSKSSKSSKPFDYQSLFGGNNNDHFMVGIKFTRRSIKLYSDFYSSDMIVASPLGLITKIGEAEVEKEKDVDYLSSIEVLIIDHADVIAMQNWSHVNTVVDQLNRLPSKQHGTDIMRIRPWYLDGQAQFYRQTIILGSYLNPDINALFNHNCLNYQGKVKLLCEYKGVLPKVLLNARQVYERFDAKSIVDADDARLEYFAKKVFPKIKDSIQGGIMLFMSSYFEFVRLRNFLKSQDASFCLLGEYTKQSDISRARIWFFQGKRKIMLYTERAHFYHRYKIRGIQNLIIYSLPERKEFYPEIVNMIEGSHNMTCTTLFSRFDQLRLERVVGTAPAKRMVTSEKGVFVFC